MKKLKYKLFSMVGALILISGCGEKVPIKEMSLAKTEITRALSVRAETYAKKEIDEAKNKLFECHDLVKNDKLDKAKEAAEKSFEKAREAYDLSIPLLAKDTLDIAIKSLDEAINAYAERLAENELKQANDILGNAQSLYEQKKYYESYERSLEADKFAKDARNIALGKKNLLRDSIDEVKATIEQANKYNASKHAPEKLNIAKENLSIAEQSFTDLLLKKGFEAVETAGLNADEAYQMALNGTARENVESAELLYNKAVNSEGAEIAKDELGGAKEALALAKSLFEGSKFKECMSSTEESERLSNVVLNAYKSAAKEKIASAEIKFLQASQSEGAVIAVTQLNAAKNALDLSKSLLEGSKYKDSTASAEESERLSIIVINTKKEGSKEALKEVSKEIISVTENDFFIYKVKYNPGRRDCLWRIAGKYYKEPLLWKKIYEQNKDKIHNPNLIWPNMLLKIPKLQMKGSSKNDNELTPINEKEAIKEEAAVDDEREE